MKTHRTPPLVLPNTSAALPVSFEQARQFLGEEAIASGERRLAIQTAGPWSIICACKGLAVTAEWVPHPSFPGTDRKEVKSYTLHGERALCRATPSGYALEGEVSIEGKKWRAFTSSLLFRLPDGKLVNCAVLHVCVGQKFSARG